ncbi:hypothetical protein [Aneurinibacillus aneurinilyticus]|uniref:Uncharacterized protein n=1 Tax=Aneurinibacillus aneurinilyticus ATCC 12856 TaxID=649747 RepID=U1WSD2_ANEAE|nr:hypothetical protein [Aneurinibacillus aneurinilyticus]ERI05158.1 hypothetical protein HMPREF0083_05731 [Aneurinibacillus aneurinilyticus ATCC 12856]MED0708180.1 hypothetical protein [Aneurinibacillus aneurinilyticus]MED0721467.1 hypothetical protein [Aneurinibacillus aneurinilyticus]MED0734065.1 hypothetical protein [Aneurinibacillus aneurinilyticus]MED0743192.1 hypothetical protein [Aneurinibacillus aneurinilyticus]
MGELKIRPRNEDGSLGEFETVFPKEGMSPEEEITVLKKELAKEKQRNKDNSFAIMELYEALEAIKGGQ